jgi:V/A-type H+-transporting ATPase subunit E
MGANAVIDKINSKVEEEVLNIIESANKKAQDNYNDIIEKAKKDSDNILKKANDKAKDYIKIQKLDANLASRKNTLALKQNIISEVFKEALEKLNSLADNDLIKLIDRLVLNECMEGNVILSVSKDHIERYKNLFDSTKIKEWEDSLKNKYGTTSKLSFEKRDFGNGGVLFVGKTYDIDASFDVLLNLVREEKENEVCNLLFKNT